MSDFVRLQWEHPNRGLQLEVLCSHHERKVLDALRVLRMACIGQEAPECNRCTRCDAR